MEIIISLHDFYSIYITFFLFRNIIFYPITMLLNYCFILYFPSFFHFLRFVSLFLEVLGFQFHLDIFLSCTRWKIHKKPFLWFSLHFLFYDRHVIYLCNLFFLQLFFSDNMDSSYFFIYLLIWSSQLKTSNFIVKDQSHSQYSKYSLKISHHLSFIKCGTFYKYRKLKISKLCQWSNFFVTWYTVTSFTISLLFPRAGKAEYRGCWWGWPSSFPSLHFHGR